MNLSSFFILWAFYTYNSRTILEKIIFPLKKSVTVSTLPGFMLRFMVLSVTSYKNHVFRKYFAIKILEKTKKQHMEQKSVLKY